MSAHTPGPWRVNSQAGYSGHCVVDAGNRSVAAFPSNSTRPKDERNGNARLIAAAPDLLEALREIHKSATGRDAVIEYKARAAIAKATGEA